jgi:hypothetical protein
MGLAVAARRLDTSVGSKNMKILFVTVPFFRLMGSRNNRASASFLSLVGRLNAFYGEDTAGLYLGDAGPLDEPYADWFSIYCNYSYYRTAILSGEHVVFDEVARAILDINPDVVMLVAGDTAVGSVDTGTVACALPIVRRLREAGYPGKIALTGTEPKLLSIMCPGKAVFEWSYFSKFDFVWLHDFALSGSAVQSIATQLGLPDYLPPENMTWNPHLAVYPYYYIHPIGSFDTLLLSVGCPWAKCTFCPMSVLTPKYGIWYTSVHSVITEAEWRHALVEHTQIYITDVGFSGMIKRKFLIYMNLLRGVFGAETTYTVEARVADIAANPKIAEEYYAYGIRTVKLGVEAADDEILNEYNKGCTVKDIQMVVSYLKSAGLSVTGFCLAGPALSGDGIDRLIEFLKSLDLAYYTTNFLCPYPGTQMFNAYMGKIFQRKLISKDGSCGRMTHLSYDVGDFWGIPEKYAYKFAQLSILKQKEDAGVGDKKYVRRILGEM